MWAGLAASPPQDRQRPVFRSGASAVAVEVTVRDRTRRSITGLQPEDFEVYDNGVLQRVDAVSYGKLPIDITIALDVSHSVTGALLDRLRNGVVQLMRDLGRDDRLEVVLFNMRVDRVIGFTRDVKAVERAIKTAKAGGGTSLLDAVSVTLVSPSTPDRRHLIVFFTDGSDSSSTTTPETLSAVAQRTRATLTFVMPRNARLAPAVVLRPGSNPTVPRTAGGLDPVPRSQAIFARLAAETGGSVLPVASSIDLTSTFRAVLGAFRSAYVLYFTPRGVDAGGYHTLDVKTRRDAVVEARRGYFGS
jgi:VWFA-related protein